ncbi:MAG: NUDIX hydrolase [Candidatus Thorarchaeota archaeon]|jgi:ADP-ribose pyrophosphatase YjhB (NUDIX family)
MNDRRYPTHPIPGVGALVFGPQGILLVKRHKEPAKGFWSLPGGGVEVGETQFDAVKREVFEETGVHCSVLNFLTTYDLILPDEDEKIKYHFLLNHYLARAETEDLKPEVPEAEVAWFNLNSLPIDEMHPAVIELVESGRNAIEKYQN